MGKSSKLFVGMDVHKESIDLAVAEEHGEVRHQGAIGGHMSALGRAVRKLESLGKPLVFVYEAGPCGFVIYRFLRTRGHDCWVVAPSLTPRQGSDCVKTDRRDSLKLARLARAGELTPIYVPQVSELRDDARGVDGLDAAKGFERVRERQPAPVRTLTLDRLGLVPSENSSGPRRRQGAITKAGSSSARRAFIEAAWAYQHNARVSWVIARRQTDLPQAVIDLAWKAQLRLCARYRKLAARGLHRNKIVVAIARELAGFVWTAGQQIKPV